MGKRNTRDKGRLNDFVPLLRETMATPAWRQLSHGARSLYVALKSRTTKYRNTAYLSYRDAHRELGAHQRSIKRWFDELQHYGFIVLHAPGELGVDGKGKAPHYRLTELGKTSAASDDGVFEPPTKDYLRWDGTIFKPPRRKNTADGSNKSEILVSRARVQLLRADTPKRHYHATWTLQRSSENLSRLRDALRLEMGRARDAVLVFGTDTG